MQGYAKAMEILESGKALEKMREIIRAQGGTAKGSADVKLSDMKRTIYSKSSGEISGINVKQCVNLAKIAGAPADKKAGIMLLVSQGDKVSEGQPILEIYAENKRKIELAEEYAKNTAIMEMQKVVLEKFE